MRQTPETQSAATAQAPPRPHGSHGPPQSTSVSVPFLLESEQVGTTHLSLVHTFEMQSVSSLQPFVSSHGPQRNPQSTSVSRPFWMLSPQFLSRQISSLQMPEVQSRSSPQLLPTTQRAHPSAPQSTSDSSPFWDPSVHEAEVHRPIIQFPPKHSSGA
jgi:hypothetical protein